MTDIYYICLTINAGLLSSYKKIGIRQLMRVINAYAVHTLLSKNSLTVIESHSFAFGASQGASIGI